MHLIKNNKKQWLSVQTLFCHMVNSKNHNKKVTSYLKTNIIFCTLENDHSIYFFYINHRSRFFKSFQR